MSRAFAVRLVTLGCRVNRAENEELARRLEALGFYVSETDDASAVIVNTCCVTGEAEAKTRKLLRREASKQGVRLVVAYGCAARVFADELRDLAPQIELAADGAEALEVVKERVFDAVLRNAGAFEPFEPFEPSFPTYDHRSRPNLKIQDGCERRCTYCIVWQARGASRSLPASEVLRKVADLSVQGFGEIVLCGVNLGSYASEGFTLALLLQWLLEKTKVGRLRLSSIEPEDVDENLFDVMAASEGRIAPYLALPLQSGCERTLRAMGRSFGADRYQKLVELARARVPDVAIATDLICGFPGETDADWAQTLAFCKKMAFANMHVFRYSRRPRTIAATLPGQLPPSVIKARSEEARALRESLRERYVAHLVGSTQRVLVEEGGWGITGGLVRARVRKSLARRTLVDLVAHSRLMPTALDCR